MGSGFADVPQVPNSHAAFVRAPLAASQRQVAALLLSIRTVVGCKQHKRLLVESQLLDGSENFAGRGVYFLNPIASMKMTMKLGDRSACTGEHKPQQSAATATQRIRHNIRRLTLAQSVKETSIA
jgi:hypothetical protein